MDTTEKKYSRGLAFLALILVGIASLLVMFGPPNLDRIVDAFGPSISTMEEYTEATTQNILNENPFFSGDAKVVEVKLKKDTDHKYHGIATVYFHTIDRTVLLPLEVEDRGQYIYVSLQGY